MTNADLIQVIEERAQLLKKIETLIDYRYAPASPRDRLRRGTVQKDLIAQLKLPRTSFLCTLINECMDKKGYKAVINRGDQYYNHITHRVSKAYGSHQ